MSNIENTIENLVCKVCECGDNESILMLCDGCDTAIHTTCIGMRNVPPGEWFCPRCINLGKHLVSSKEEVEEPKKEYTHVAYLRVSTKGQDKPEYGRVGLITQNSAVLRWAIENGVIIHSTTCEVGSAYTDKPLVELKKLVRKIKKDTIICVYSVSRFSRKENKAIELLEMLHSKGCAVFSVSEELLSNRDTTAFLDAVKQAENEGHNISQRAIDTAKRLKDEENKVVREVKKIYNAQGQRDVNKTMLEIQKRGMKKRVIKKTGRAQDITPRMVERWCCGTRGYNQFARDLSKCLD